MDDEEKDLGDATLDLSKDDSVNKEDDETLLDEKDTKEGRISDKITAEPGDPVRVLQLSQPFFVADTLDDDVSLIIPPTPGDDTVPFMVPSTPEDHHKDILEESQTLLDDKDSSLGKQLCFDVESDDDEDDWTKPTQPLLPLKKKTDAVEENLEESNEQVDETFAATETMLEECYKSRSPKESDKNEQSPKPFDPCEDTEDWHLRLTGTQETQDLEEFDEILPETQRAKCDETKIEEVADSPLKDNETSSIIKSSPTHEIEPVASDVESPSPEKPLFNIERPDKTKALVEKESSPPKESLFSKIDKLAKDSNTPVKSTRQLEASEAVLPISPKSKESITTFSEKQPFGRDDDDEEEDDDEIEPSQETSSEIRGGTMFRSLTLLPDTQPSNSANKSSVDVIEVEEKEDSEDELPETIDVKGKRESEESHKISTDEIQGCPSPISQMLPPTRTYKKYNLLSATLKQKREKSIGNEAIEMVAANDEENSIKEDVSSKTNQEIQTDDLSRSQLLVDAFTDTLIKQDVPSMMDQEIQTDDPTGNVISHSQRLVGAFKDAITLEKLFQTIGISFDKEGIKTLTNSLKQTDEKELIFKKTVVSKITIKDSKMYKEVFVQDEDRIVHPSQVEMSPITSTSSTTASKTSGRGSIPSGEMGDISSSVSSKSLSSISSGTLNEIVRLRSSQTLSSQEPSLEMSACQFKTSTQNKDAVSFTTIASEIFESVRTEIAESLAEDKDNFRSPMVILSPINKHKKNASNKSKDSDSSDFASLSKPKRGRNTKKSVTKDATSDKKQDSSVVPSPALKRRRKNVKEETDQSSAASTDENKSTNFVTAKKTVPETKRKVAGRKKKAITTISIDDTDTASSTKDDFTKPSTSTSGVIDDSASAQTPYGSILPGVRVMARWKDGFYYPGTVQSQELEGRWRVQFDDNDIRTISQDNLLKIALLQVGTSVFAMTSGEWYDPGIISAHYRDGKETGYVVEQDSGVTKRYPRASVILSTDQAKLIINSRPKAPPTLTINLDNIIGGKRKRKSMQSPDSSVVSPQKVARSHKRKEKPDSNLDSTESSANDMVTTEKSIITKIQEEFNKVDEETLLSRQKRLQAKRNLNKKGSAKKKDQKNQQQSIELTTSAITPTESPKTSPSPKTTPVSDASATRGSKLFQGHAFLLSHAVRKSEDRESNDATSDNDEDKEPYDKEHLCRQILSEGGLVLETFEEAQKCTKRKIFLLANTHLRTIKYIQCIAANVPCIKHYWVHNCCLTRQILDLRAYSLPSGFSILKNSVTEWHSKTDALKGLKIVVTAEKKSDFVNIWAPVLLAAKAEVVQKWKLPDASKPGAFFADIIVTNATCPNSVLTIAKRGKIPVVSSEWIIQCIIAGSKLPHDAHPKFKHNFKE